MLRVYFVLQASEDAKKLVDEERAFARAEIENAREAVQRVEEALQEHERMSRAAGKQVFSSSIIVFRDYVLRVHNPSLICNLVFVFPYRINFNILFKKQYIQPIR